MSLQTLIKFEIFDVYDRPESKVGVACITMGGANCLIFLQMCPIGQAQCSVMDIMKARDRSCRLDILFDNAICGYLHIRAWKVSGGRGEGGRVCDVLLVLQSADGEMDPLEECPFSPPSKSSSPDPLFEMGDDEQDRGPGKNGPPVEIGGELVSPSRFTFSAPMDNIVIRSFEFPIV